MRNNINSILPRIAGITVLAGVGALALFLLFKVLMVVLLVSFAVFAFKSAMMLISQARERLGDRYDEYDGYLDRGDYERPQPFTHYNKELAIIPIK